MARIAVFRALRAFMGPADRRPEFRETADRLIELNFSAADGLSDVHAPFSTHFSLILNYRNKRLVGLGP